MSDANLRQIRVLHIVSAGGVASALQSSLFMPLLTRLPRQRVKAQVACLSPGAVPSAILRQNGVPTFDLALSRKRFSPRAFQELRQAARHFRPDVIQAWGHTAQIASALLRKRCDWKPKLVWSISDTTPLARDAGLIDRQKLKYAASFSSSADRVVYTSESAASQHRRAGFPDGGHEMIPPGVDATRFKPDFAARRKLREELSLPGETFVIGMVAPFQPEFDHATLIRALGDLVKANPNIAVVLAGHGVQKGNAPLIALIGSGALSTRTHLLGEWSDISALYNACDVVCSSSVNDQSRMYVVMAMLCGVPCVATGIGAQGELIGQHGIAIEPGSPAAFVKALTRVMQLSPEKRTHMAQGARKHALANYVYVRSLQKYLQLYYDLIGRQSLVTQDLPTPEVDASLTVPPALPTEAEMNASKRKSIKVADLSDPDSLEAKVAERKAEEELPKWRIEQEEERNKREAELAAKIAASNSVGDVLQVFESQQKAAAGSETPMTERARGVADDSEELLSPELLAAEAPPLPRVSSAPSGAKRTSAPAAEKSAPQQDAAKQAALKAARMAALQPIAPSPRPVAAPKASSATTKPPVTRPTSSPLTRPLASTELAAAATKAPASVAPVEAKSSPSVAAPAAEPAVSAAQATTDRAQSALDEFTLDTPKPSQDPAEPATAQSKIAAPVAGASIESEAKPVVAADMLGSVSERPDIGSTQPIELLPEFSLLQPLEANTSKPAAAAPEKVDTQLSQMLPSSTEANVSKPAETEKAGTVGTQPVDMLADLELPQLVGANVSKPAAAAPAQVDFSSVQPSDLLLEIDLSPSVQTNVSKPAATAPEKNVSKAAADEQEKFDLGSTQPLGILAQELANAALPAIELAKLLAQGSKSAEDAKASAASENSSELQSLELPSDVLPPGSKSRSDAAPSAKKNEVSPTKPPVVEKAPEVETPSSNNLTEFGELALLATGEWQALQRSDVKPEATDTSATGELSGPDTLSLISTPAPKSDTADPTIELSLLSDAEVARKRAANGE